MPASAAEGSSSNSISGGSCTTTPPQDLVVPSTARQDDEPSRTRDENGNWTGETRQSIVAAVPVPAAPAAAPSAPADAAQSNVSPASVPADNSLSRHMTMAERQEQQSEERAQEPQQLPVAGNARQQFVMERPPAFYPNAVAQPVWPQFGRGSAQADDYYRRAPSTLPYLPNLGYSSLARASSPLMPTVPVYSPSPVFCAGSPSYPSPPQVNSLNYFAGGRSAPSRFPRPIAWEQQSAAALPMLFEHVAPPAEQPPPMYHVLLECPGAFSPAAPNAQLLPILPYGSAGGGWSVLQPMGALPSSGLGPSGCNTRRASSPDSSSPEVGRAGVDARPVSVPAAAGLSASAGEQRQTTGVDGTAMHAPPRPAARSGPAAGAPLAAGSQASASHAVGAMASAAGSWRIQDGGATGWTPAAAQQVAGPTMLQVMLLPPSFVGSSLALALPQPPAGSSLALAFPQPASAGQQQQCVLGYITPAPSQPWQQSFSPRQQLQQQQQPQQPQPPRRTQASVATSSFGAAPAQVGHDSTPSTTSQAEGERQRSTGLTVSAPPQLQFDQNSLQHRRSSLTNGVARAASRSPSIDGAVQSFPESGLDLLDGSDALDVRLSVLDIASDSEEAAYEPQHRSRPRTNSPALPSPPPSPPFKF